MFGTQDLSVFLLAAISLSLLPGSDTIYIITRSIGQGRKAGVASVLGISTGLLLHTSAATFGLSAILATSVIAFNIVKLIGATYLVYLGIQMFFNNSSQETTDITKTKEANLSTIYRQGILTNVFNPKVALFFLALLPQFVDPANSHKAFSFFFLGCMFITTSTTWSMFVALLAAKASSIVRSKTRFMDFAKRVTGVIFIGMGIKLATEQAK
ncbi:LysE family translocator [Myxosarcina sp. GI1]|uniref:LysE family translocator n=1 Tax=Myxosarcina sp. GI1 TaxID=1541065 RepID=UPI0005689056|nr:LysE family translocator [Myxosarcina sp. GI1]